MIKKIFSLALLVKVAVLMLIFLAFNLLPFNSKTYFANFIYPQNEKISLATAYKTWDAQHYLFLSQQGYKANSGSDTFFPALPFSISLVNKLINNPVIAGLIVSNLFSFLGIFYFFLFCRSFLKNEEQAFKSALLLLAFPTAFFLTLIYSESILLFLTSAFFYYLYSKKYAWAAIFAFFIPLTRPVGMLIIFPYIVFWLTTKYKEAGRNYLDLFKKVLLDRRTYYLLSPVLGILLYFLIMQLTTGNYWEGMRLEYAIVGAWKVSNVFDPIYFLVSLFSPGGFVVHGFTNSIIDRVFFVIYCVFLVVIYKRLDKTMFIYALMFGMTPLLGSFMSYTRYVLMVFPIFVVLAKIFAEKKYSLLFYPTLFFMLMLQTLFIIMHALNYWVA
jgi:hypothetical protein